MSILSLRAPTENDAEALSRLFLDETVGKTYMVPDFASPAEALVLAKKVIALSGQDGRFVRGVYLDGELIGLVNDVGIDKSSVELGWAILSEHHGKGFGTAAARLAAKELFSLGFEEIRAGAFENNTASRRVMEKLGMERTGTETVTYRGTVHECVTYSLGKDRFNG